MDIKERCMAVSLMLQWIAEATAGQWPLAVVVIHMGGDGPETVTMKRSFTVRRFGAEAVDVATCRIWDVKTVHSLREPRAILLAEIEEMHRGMVARIDRIEAGTD